MKLIPEAKKAWRMFSVQANAINVAILGAWQALPDDFKATFPPHFIYWLAIGLLLAGTFGRLIDQPSVRE